MAVQRQANPNEAVAARHEGITTGTHFNGRIHLDRDALVKPLKVRRPQTWAVWDDLFYGDERDRRGCEFQRTPFEPVPFEFIDHAFANMIAANWHTFYILTKRPERMRDVVCQWEHVTRLSMSRYGHICLGTTAGTQKSADENIPLLLETPAAVRFVSMEPLLEPVDLTQFYTVWDKPGAHVRTWTQGIDQIIIGAETGPRRRPCNVEWVRDLVQQCDAAGVRVFVKALDLDGRVSKNMAEWPADLRRREYPR